MSFTLDPTIESDTVFIADLELSQVRMSKNASFPWILLVPRRPDMVEIIDLAEEDQAVLWQEVKQASHIVKELFQPKKLNVANLGNIVPQLHVHVVARFENDSAWPGPIWGSGVKTDFDDTALQQRISQLQTAFNALFAGAGA